MRENTRNKLTAYCKKIASKGGIRLKIAQLIMVVYIVVDKLLFINRYAIARVCCAFLIILTFLSEASFTPMKFDDGSYDIDNYEELVKLDSAESQEEEYLITEVTNEEDIANLDDLVNNVDVDDLNGTEGVGVKKDFDKNDWKLLLVNKTHTIPDDYTFTLGVIKGSMKCDERILKPLTEMFEAAAKEGVNLTVVSPYRDLSRQEYLFERKMKNYINMGYSYIEAYKVSSQAVTVPGASEHQIGLSLDILCDTYKNLDEGFGDTKEGEWMAQNSYKYGFILRYPSGKEDITGIMYEPWHFRYVGIDAATEIFENNETLEEFIERL